MPVMIGISMMPRERARRLSLFGAAFFFVLLIFVPILGPEMNGAKRWIDFGVGQLQPSEFLKPFFVVAMAWLLSLRESDKSLPVFPLSALRHRRDRLPADAAARLRQRRSSSAAVWIAMLALAGRQHADPARPRRRAALVGDRPRLFLLRRRDGAHRRLPVRRRATTSRPTMRCAR